MQIGGLSRLMVVNYYRLRTLAMVSIIAILKKWRNKKSRLKACFFLN
jgi:hypothetical protein